MRPTAHRGSQRVLDHFRRSETRLVRHDHIGCRLHVDQTPTEFVIRPRIAQIIGRVGEQALQHTRTHSLSGELARIQLCEQRSRTRGRWRGHARAAVRSISGVGGIDRRIDSNTVGHHVGLDAPVVGRAPAGEVRHRAGRRGTHTAAYRVVDRTDGQDVFRKTVVGDRLEPTLGGEKVLLITRRPANQIIRHGNRQLIGFHGLVVVDAHIGSSCVVAVGMVREWYLGRVARHGRRARRGHLRVVAAPIPGIDGDTGRHAFGAGREARSTHRSSHVGGMIIKGCGGVAVDDAVGVELLVRIAHPSGIPHADFHSRAAEVVRCGIEQIGPAGDGRIAV